MFTRVIAGGLSMMLGAVVLTSAELFIPVPPNQMADMAPDLQARVEKLRQDRTTKDVSVVRIDLKALSKADLDLNLMANTTSHATRTRMDPAGDGAYTWYGSLAGTPGDAILAVRNGTVTGTIRRGAQLFRVKSLGEGLHALIEVDESKFPPEHPPSFKKIEEATPPRPTARPTAKTNADAAPGTPTIDVLVAYTPAAKIAAGNIDGLIQLALAETNDSYKHSHINAVMKLALAMPVDYAEADRTFETILAHFAGKNDGFMDVIHAARDRVQADVAVLLINKTDYCGLADAIMASADTAFAIVHYGCATGYYSFGHEVGHLQGARHNPEADPTPQPFAYGHGYQYLPSWRTIMAYDCPDHCPRLEYWANPDVNYQGIPMGTAARNYDARVLNETAATVAAFRP